MRKPKKFHLRDKSTNLRVAVCKTESVNIVDDLNDVDCLRCHRLAGSRTTEQGGPQVDRGRRDGLNDLIVTSTGPMFINFIKAVRALPYTVPGISSFVEPKILKERYNGYLSLKESKDFADGVRDGGPQMLAKGITLEQATLVRLALESTGASIQVVSSYSGPHATGSGQMTIEQAYREMIALYVPNDIQRKALYARGETLDWSACFVPTVADVRRWLDASK